MARVLMDGFEVGLQNWTTNKASLSTEQKRSGDRALKLEGNNGTATISHPQLNELYLRFWVYVNPFLTSNLTSNAHWECIVGTLTSRVVIILNGNGRLSGSIGAYTVEGTTQLQWNTGYLIEAHVITGTQGRLRIRVDGGPALEIDMSGAITAAPTQIQLRSGTYVSSNASTYFDDFAINDTTGTVHHSWCGPGRIVYLPVDGNGTTQDWSPSTGSDQAALLDETPTNEDIDYIYQSEDGKVSEFTLATNEVLTGKDIWLVRPLGSARKTDATSLKTIQVGLDSGGTIVESPKLSLQTSWTIVPGRIYTTDPKTSEPWTLAAVNDLKARVTTSAES